jgi:transcriptional regulator
MKRIAYIVVILCMFLSCGIRREYKDALLRAEAVMDEHPDSALQILDSLGQYESEFTRHFRMQYQLHRQNAVNKTSDKFTSDSLCQVLVSYFDRHGTVNERVLAHYLLGRAYTDMGDAPQAISSYQDAISAADTTVTGFKFSTLNRIYAQMADIYHHQLLLTDEIETRKKASYYAFRANQPKWGIYNQAMMANAYILLNQKDTAETILKAVREQFRKHGYTQEALRYSRPLMHLYTNPPQRLTEAKALMDQFEAESELFDERHELPPSQRKYYEYKGKYYEGINKLDSAEFYYRKTRYPNMDYTAQDPMYKGLLSVFTKRHQADSIAKYARLYCMANDSSIALKDRDAVAQMTATYNYSRLQKEAHENEVKAYKTLLGLIIAAAVAVLALVAVFLVWKRFRRKYQQEIMQLKTEYANASYEYEENLRELQLLESAHQENESERKRLLDENVELQSRIRELQKEKAISRNLSASALFAEEPIVKRFHEIAVQPLANVKEEEWAELTDTFANSYPDLFLDLCQYCNTPQSIRVCMLTVMGLGNNEQANLLGTTSSRISNVKLALNKALFNESSSRTLNKNLLMQYSVY